MNEQYTINLADLAETAVDAPAPESFVTPNHKASRGVDSGAPTPGSKRPGIFGARSDRSAPRKTQRTIKADPPYRKGEYTETIATAYEVVGAMLMPFDPHCGQVVTDAAEKAAEAWDDAAEKSPRLRRFLKMATTGSVWGAVVVANVPIIMAVASHHTPIVEATQRRVMSMMAQRAQQQARDDYDADVNEQKQGQ